MKQQRFDIDLLDLTSKTEMGMRESDTKCLAFEF